MKIRKLLLATVGATVLFGALVASASARSFSVSNQSISAMWRQVIFSGGFGNTNCQVTLEGSLHSRTIAKTIGSLVGYITSAILGPCTEGAATILQERLPWHVKYSGFEPRLPEIRSIITHVIGASFRIREAFGVTCHTVTTAAEPGIGTFHREPRTHEIIEVSIGGRTRTGAECFGAQGTLSSREGVVSLLGTSGTRISVSLI